MNYAVLIALVDFVPRVFKHDVGGTFFYFDRSRVFVLLYPLDHSRGIKRTPAIERAKKGNTVCQTHVEIHATLKFAAGSVFQFPVLLRKI